MDLQGDAHVLWQQLGTHWMAGVASPDGRHLEIAASSMDANMWLMENF